MQPIPHPETIRMIHQTMIHEELQRRYPQHHVYFRHVEPRQGFIMRLRRFTASILISAGNRIAVAGQAEPSLAVQAGK